MSYSEENGQVIAVLVECGGRKFRVIDNLRNLVGGETDRCIAEARIGRKVLDLARSFKGMTPYQVEAEKKS